MAFKAFTQQSMPQAVQRGADGGYTAINPATGQRERIIAVPVMGADGGFEGEQQGWESENVGATGPMGVAPSHSGVDIPDTGSDWKDMLSNFGEAAAGAATVYGGMAAAGLAGAAGGAAGTAASSMPWADFVLPGAVEAGAAGTVASSMPWDDFRMPELSGPDSSMPWDDFRIPAEQSAIPPWLEKIIGPGASAAVKAAGGAATQAGKGIISQLLSGLGIDPSGIAGLLGGLADNGLSLAARSAPGLMALDYAKSQGDTDTTSLEGILAKITGNQDAVVKAATDPMQANIAAGYGDLVQSQGLRGIRGSSFGDTDISNYISRTGTALAGAGANAASGSLALQGTLAAQIAKLKADAQVAKNNLFGKAFDVLGRGINPGGFGSSLTLAGP